MAHKASQYDITGKIIAFENGELNDEEVAELFQKLVDTGLAWQLQGSYGRAAIEMIDKGIIYSAAEGAE